MGIFDGVSNFLFGNQPAPYTPPVSQVPGYQQDPSQGMLQNNLVNLLMSNAQRYNQSYNPQPVNTQGPGSTYNPVDFTTPTPQSQILPQSYTDAVMGTATRNANYTADQSEGRYNEQMNNMGLLGSSGQAAGLGQIELGRQNEIGNARDQVTQQEFQYQNQQANRAQQGQQMALQSQLQNRGMDLQGRGLNQGDVSLTNQGQQINNQGLSSLMSSGSNLTNILSNNAMNQFNAGLSGANFQNNAAQQAQNSRQQQWDNSTNSTMGLLGLGAGIYGRYNGGLSGGNIFGGGGTGTGVSPAVRNSYGSVGGSAGSPGYLMGLMKSNYGGY